MITRDRFYDWRGETWYDVNAYSPPIRQAVLTWCDFEPCMAFLRSDGIWETIDGVLIDGVTHWMFLPSPPKDATDKEILTCPSRPYIE